MAESNQQGSKSKKIVLIGMPGSGKSTVGQKLAARLGWPWYDSDREIEKQEGMRIAEIFSRFGEPCFRELETQCLKDLFRNQHDSAVLSLGGGAVRNFVTEDAQGTAKPLLAESLWQNCLFIYLHRNVADILNSVDLRDRPLLQDNPERIAELYRQRHPLYQQISHVRIENDGSAEEAVDKVWQAVEEILGDNESAPQEHCRDCLNTTHCEAEAESMKLLVINGPNLNLLGTREPGVYGTDSYAALLAHIDALAREHEITVDVMQTNSEGEIIDAIHGSRDRYDGIILNPGAYTHYSYAILDALQAVPVPAIEVHLSNISGREEFRRISVTAPACAGQISGLGFYSYSAAVRYFLEKR